MRGFDSHPRLQNIRFIVCQLYANWDLANSMQLGMQLGKTPDGHLFVGVHLKDFVQLSDLQHAMYLFRRIQQL
jgi:hypothetical protein